MLDGKLSSNGGRQLFGDGLTAPWCGRDLVVSGPPHVAGALQPDNPVAFFTFSGGDMDRNLDSCTETRRDNKY